MNQEKKEKPQNFSSNLDEDEDYVQNNYNKKKLLSFPLKFNNKRRCSCWLCKILDSAKTKIKYESINVVSEDGYSICYPPLEELKGGKVFVSLDAISDIEKEELYKRFGFGGLNNNEL